jgi:crotonobetainyl-CoA:carnitine CoA-transferase CaiB-like acyl-CoA transferase
MKEGKKVRLPLEGIKILELAQSIGSPYCTSMMADFGADVIQVEPRQGARTRNMGTTFLEGECSSYVSLNRNKRNIALDIRTEQGKEIVLKLAKDSDIVTENFRPGVLDRLGLGYEALSKNNPRLIYLSITGFGPKGPWKNRPGIEMIFQGYSSLANLQGRDAEGIPRFVAGAPTDMQAGVFAFMGIMLALFEREKSGLGQKVETANLMTAISMLSFHIQAFLMGRSSAEESTTIVPFKGFRSKDGYLAIGIPSDQYWPNFCKALGIQHLEKEPMFATNVARVKNKDAVETLIQSILEQKTTSEWLKIFEEADSLGGPMYNPEETLNDPQVLANDMVVTVDHSTCGKLKMIGIPIKLSRTPGRVKSAPPTLGQHTNEILRELGYTKDKIEELRKLEVIL